MPHIHTKPGQIDDGESTQIRLFTLKELRAIPSKNIPIDFKEICEYVLQINLKEWTLEAADKQ